MAQMEEEHDTHHMLALLLLRQFFSPWTFRIHCDLRTRFRHLGYNGLWSHLVPEHHVRDWNAHHRSMLP